MPFLMSDVAAGSNAALQLQQNMAAIPDVQQAQANKMQEAQVKLQQDQENLSKTKLANIVADTGIKSEAKKQDIVAKWMQDPANKNKSETDMASGLSKAFMMGGLVVDGEKLSQQATLAASKAVLTEQRQLDNNDRELYKAVAVIDAMDVNNITEDFKKLPEQSQRAVLSQIGEPLWNKFSNEEKKAAVYKLLMSGVRRNAAQAIAVDTNKQTLIGDYKVKNTETHEAEATKRRAMGDTAAMERVVVQEARRTERAEDKERGTQERFQTKEKRLTWNEYSLRNTDIESRGNRVVQNLNKRVQEKAAEIEKLSLSSDSKAQLKANAAWKEAVEERDDAYRKVLQRQYDLALNAPDSFGGKQRVLNSIKAQMELVGSKQEAPKAAPAATSSKGSAFGLVEKGNIDLAARPVVKNKDGSISTVRSMSFEEDGKEVLIPTVVGDKVVSDKEAIAHYRKTGEHLGKFDSPKAANAYAKTLHEQQDKMYGLQSKVEASGQKYEPTKYDYRVAPDGSIQRKAK